MSTLPLRYWCEVCGQLLFRTDRDATGLVETICRNRRCRLNRDKEPRVTRVPEDARERPSLIAYRRRLEVTDLARILAS